MSVDNLDIQEWIRFAQMDYDSARKMADTFHPVPIEIVCYHCQQSAEKILKAFVIANKGSPIKTHDLAILLKQCSLNTDAFEPYREACTALSSYAALSRYPSNVEITELQMNQALSYALEILEFTKARLAELYAGLL